MKPQQLFFPAGLVSTSKWPKNLNTVPMFAEFSAMFMGGKRPLSGLDKGTFPKKSKFTFLLFEEKNPAYGRQRIS